jgi:CHAD domain-containing protein
MTLPLAVELLTHPIAPKLTPNMRADVACKAICHYLLEVIKTNEAGVLSKGDSEFLHQFRVAIRKTRAGLGQFKGVLPDAVNAHYAEFFAWLGEITTPTRDLDVYLLNFDAYKNSLPPTLCEYLEPLRDFLHIKQQQSQQELNRKLHFNDYAAALAEWERYLQEKAPKHPHEPYAKWAIKALANRRIWALFNRVVDEGDAITAQSAAEVFHELRKSCKKLRYLMEFFQTLYPQRHIKALLKNLKGLQDVLGGIQDYQVQAEHLRLFSEELLARDIPANTLMAIGALIQNLEARRCEARGEFAEKYAHFKQAKNRRVFGVLFAGGH